MKNKTNIDFCEKGITAKKFKTTTNIDREENESDWLYLTSRLESRNFKRNLFLEELGKAYFDCPASSKYHLACENGLLEHSLNVHSVFQNQILRIKDNTIIPYESMIIVSLFHDLCKVGAYIKTSTGYEYNKEHPKGHGTLSIQMLSRYIDLTEQEKNLIKFHMGVYGIKSGEYTAEELEKATSEDFLVQVFACADMIATKNED